MTAFSIIRHCIFNARHYFTSMKFFILILIPFIICISCSNQDSVKAVTPGVDSVTEIPNNITDPDFANKGEVKEETCFIKNIAQENGQVFIYADYIQRFSGERAIEEAKKRGDADTFYVDGKREIAVVNDYYIVNASQKIRKLALDSTAVFELQYNPDAGRIDNNLSGLKKIYKESVFILTVKNESVIKIFEIFIP
jgi:hypothetical protein